MDLRERRELYNGFSDTLARAVEFVAVPAVFAFLGHLLDGLLGTGSVFTVALAVFALAGTFVRAYYAYDVAMREQEAGAPWARPGRPPGGAS
ncbi:MAG: AtpZ/AtpI family protein [Actinomycetota bacterium]|nr:AtpZ/AtpI family protein [Actinomycetota bacterium]